MNLVCLDLEGVLIPEIWVAFAHAAGIPELTRTTRDEPDYDKLMQYRLDILAQHNFTLADIHRVVDTLDPLPGAMEFVEWLKNETQLIILSDTFVQFPKPLLKKLGFPTVFCHELEIDAGGRITGYKLRQKDQKRKAVLAFQSLNYRVIAAGDSYNDLTMLQTAEEGILFCPPDSMKKEYPDFPVATTHEELRRLIQIRLAADA